MKTSPKDVSNKEILQELKHIHADNAETKVELNKLHADNIGIRVELKELRTESTETLEVVHGLVQHMDDRFVTVERRLGRG